jgi:SulP family sulfate permease
VGQGIANILCPFFGGFAATGAIARTATNVKNGGNSPVAGLIHAAVLLLVIKILAPLAQYIPLATLAAILFTVAYNMSNVRSFFYILIRSPRSDAIVLVTTFLLTLFEDLVVAVHVGVILSSLLFMRRMAQSVTIKRNGIGKLSHETVPPLPSNTALYTVNGPLFWGAKEALERVVSRIASPTTQVVIFQLKYTPFIDATGLLTLAEAWRDLETRGIKMILCEANRNVQHKIRRAKIRNVSETEAIGCSLSEALKAL